MDKYLTLTLILFFSLDINASECNSSDPDLNTLCNTIEDGADFMEVSLKILALGAIYFVAVGATGAGLVAGEVAKEDESSFTYEFTGDKIIFQGNHRLENLEINFSNPIEQNEYQQLFQINEEHYVGLTWRF